MTFDGIRFFRSEFPEGSSFTYMYFQDTPYNRIASTHYQSSGRMTGGGFIHEADWYSREDNSVIPYGPLTLTAEMPSIRWCCVGLADNEPTDYVSLIRAAQGAIIELGINDNLLILKGRLMTSAGPLYEAQHVFSTRSTTLLCTQDSVVYTWNSESVRAHYQNDVLREAKTARWELMKGIRSAKDVGGFQYLGRWFDSDANARRNIADATQLAMMSNDYTVEWTLEDNTSVMLDSTQVREMGAALAMHISKNHEISRKLRDRIMAANTLEEVESVRWP